MASLLEIIAAKNPQQAKNKLAELASNTKDAIFNQWQQGEPYRIASGALMMGDPATAKKVIEERFANTTPQDIYSAAQDVGVDFAQNPIAGGLAGIFAGIGAKTADVAKLGLAQEMKAQGIADDVIHAKTGWFSGMPDGKWRFEIPDDAAKLTKAYRSERASNFTGVDVGKAVDHKPLFDAYPEVADYNASFSDKTFQGGRFSEPDSFGFGKIEVGYGSPQPKSTTLHELQHAIQQREGFARGGSPETFVAGNQLNPATGQLVTGREGYDMYKRLAGEAEARLTQARMNMTAKQRAASYPPSMFDVPVEQQIVRYGDGVNMAAMSNDYPKNDAGLFDTVGLPNRGRELIQGKAEEFAQRLRNAGIPIELQHSGSLAGPSSYIKIHGLPDIRISGHSKGVFNSQGVINVASEEDFLRVLEAAQKRYPKLTEEEISHILSRQKQEEISTMYPIRLKSADKKLAKGKRLTKSEQEAIEWRDKQK